MSNSTAQQSTAKRRPYRLGKRAEQQAQTRQRIVEAAVELHGTLGPAHTSVAQIAERAGVQRHTFYAHFPDERSLSLACSGHSMERDPLPDVEQWTAVEPGARRVRYGLQQIYDWYERNEQLTACVVRDAEMHALTREIVEMRMGPSFARAAELLGEGLAERAGPLVALALDFACWRVLHRSLSNAKAAALMADTIAGAGDA